MENIARIDLNENRSKKQIKIGSIISFFLLAIDIITALFFPKWINAVIGKSDYGIYSLSNSLIWIFLIDFGIGLASSKFLSKIIINNELDKQKDYLSIIYKIYLIIDVMIAIMFTILYFLLDVICTGLSKEGLRYLKIIFPILAVYNVINFPFYCLNGILVSHEKFIVLKSFDLLQKVLYSALMSLFLILKLNVVYVSIASVLSGLIILISKFLFCYFKCNMRVNFKYWDKKIAKKIFGFSIWITLGIIASKLITSIMPLVLSNVSDEMNIAEYNFAYSLACNAYLLTTIVSSMTLPYVTRLMKNRKTSNEKVDSLISKVGKIQVFIIFLFFFGFVVFGKEFLLILMGKDYLNSYYCFILLFIPNLISGSLDVCENVTQVTNNIKFSSVIRLISGIFVLLTSLKFGKLYGSIGVCACYAFFQLLSCVLIIVFVYSKKLKINMKKILFKMYLPTIIPIGVPFALFLVLKRFFSFSSVLRFCLGIAVFAIIYLSLYYFLSTNESEKVFIFKKIFKKKFDSEKKNYSSNFIMVDDKKIKLKKEKICNIKLEKKFNKLEVNTLKYGNSTGLNDVENSNYYFCFDKEKLNDNEANVLICNNDVFDKIKSENNYDKIIVIEVEK